MAQHQEQQAEATDKAHVYVATAFVHSFVVRVGDDEYEIGHDKENPTEVPAAALDEIRKSAKVSGVSVRIVQ
jgi:hypothetical protein